MEKHKESPLGKIPKDWIVNKLSEFTDEITDYVAAGSFADLKNNIQVYSEPNYAVYVRLTDLRKGLGHHEQKYVDKDSYEFLIKSNLYGREILFANIGANVGEVWMMPKIATKATIAPNMIVIRANNTKVVPEYLHSYFRSPIGLRQINKIIAGSGHPKINKTELRQLLAILPPLPEQQKIAEILSTVDDKIEVIEHQITETQELKKGLMQRLLTKGIGHTEFKDSVLGKISKNSKVSKLSEVSDEITDYVAAGSFAALKDNIKVFSEPNYAIYVRLTDLRKGLGHQEQKYVDKASYEFLKKSNLYGREILFANIGANVGEVWMMPKMGMKATIAPNMIVIRANNIMVIPEYLHSYFRSTIGLRQIKKIIAGSGHPKINKTELRQLLVILPSLNEQQKIADILNSIDAKLEVLIEKKKHYQELKQGLMQQLLTGKIRVKV